MLLNALRTDIIKKESDSRIQIQGHALKIANKNLYCKLGSSPLETIQKKKGPDASADTALRDQSGVEGKYYSRIYCLTWV